MAATGNPEDFAELSPQVEMEMVDLEVNLAAIKVISLWYSLEREIKDPFREIYGCDYRPLEIVGVFSDDYGVTATVILEHEEREYCLRVGSSNWPNPKYPKEVVVCLRDRDNDSREFSELDVLRNGVPKPAQAIR